MSRSNMIFVSLFCIIISIQYGLVNTNLEITGFLSTIIMLIEMLIFFLYIVNKNYKMRILIGIGFLLFVAFVSYITTGETVFMIMIMVGVVAGEGNWERLFYTIFYVRLGMLILIVSLAIMGVINNTAISIIKGGTTEEIIGYGGGFDHPNQFAFMIGYLLLLWIACKSENIRSYHLVALAICTCIGYYITRSRTLIIVIFYVILMCLVYIMNCKKNAIKKCIYIVGEIFMPTCALMALGLPVLMTNATGRVQEILYTINGIFGSRFTHSARVYENYPIPIFGGITDFDILQKLYQYSVVDNGYLRLLYNFGIIGFTLFIILYLLTIRKLAHNGKYIWIILIMGVSLWGISENILRTFAFNFTPIFWGVLLMEKQSTE